MKKIESDIVVKLAEIAFEYGFSFADTQEHDDIIEIARWRWDKAYVFLYKCDNDDEDLWIYFNDGADWTKGQDEWSEWLNKETWKNFISYI